MKEETTEEGRLIFSLIILARNLKAAGYKLEKVQHVFNKALDAAYEIPRWDQTS